MIRLLLIFSIFVYCGSAGASVIDQLYAGVPHEFSQMAMKRFFDWYQSTCEIDLKSDNVNSKLRRVENELRSVISFSRPVDENGQLVSPLFSWRFKGGIKTCYSVLLPHKDGDGKGVEIFFNGDKEKLVSFGELVKPRSTRWVKLLRDNPKLQSVSLFGEFILNTRYADGKTADIMFLFDLYPGFLSKEADLWTQKVLKEFYFKPRALRFIEDSTIVYFP